MKFRIRSALTMLILGSVILVAGFLLPPPGEIHNSVLVAFGEILTFTGTLLGIELKISKPKDSNNPS